MGDVVAVVNIGQLVTLAGPARALVRTRLDAGPLEDLRAIALRQTQEIDPRVADSVDSLVEVQVRSGLVVRMAVLYDVLTQGAGEVNAGGAIALVNSFGALGSFVGTYVVGFLNGATGGDAASYLFMAASLLAATAFTLAVRRPAAEPASTQSHGNLDGKVKHHSAPASNQGLLAGVIPDGLLAVPDVLEIMHYCRDTE